MKKGSGFRDARKDEDRKIGRREGKGGEEKKSGWRKEEIGVVEMVKRFSGRFRKNGKNSA